MITRTFLVLPIGSIFALAACGGSSSNPVDAFALYDAFDAAREGAGNSGGAYSAANVLPSGTASFDGVISVFETDGTDSPFSGSSDDQVFGAFGSVSLTANFDAGTVTGDATGFREYDVSDPFVNDDFVGPDIGALEGEFAINSVIDTSNGLAEIGGDITGNLQRADGTTANFDFDVTQGGFTETDKLYLNIFAVGDAGFDDDGVTAGAVIFAE